MMGHVKVEIPENIPGKPVAGADVVGDNELMTQPGYGDLPLLVDGREFITGIDMRGQEN